MFWNRFTSVELNDGKSESKYDKSSTVDKFDSKYDSKYDSKFETKYDTYDEDDLKKGKQWYANLRKMTWIHLILSFLSTSVYIGLYLSLKH